jgi:beta-phosphoglucomutase-like phosphatase (HAD superfamily)
MTAAPPDPAIMEGIDLIIFDCDGVLVDSERISNEVLSEILGEHGLRLSWQEAKAVFLGQSVDDVRTNAAIRFGIELPADWSHSYYARMIPALAERVEAIDGAPAAVASVATAGLRCCVASQGPVEKMRATLGRTGLWESLDGQIYSAKAVARPKPAPDLFLHAATAMGTAPDRCLVIEDSALGVTAAVAAGMRVLAYCPEEDDGPMRALGAVPFGSMHDIAALLRSARG